MDYERTVMCRGDKARALQFLRDSFTSKGFKVTRDEAKSVVLQLKRMSKKGDEPIMSVSEAKIDVIGDEIRLCAAFDNMRRAYKFSAIMLVLMAVGFLVIFGVQMSRVPWAVLLPLSPWPMLLPLLYFFLKSRCKKSLDLLLEKMAEGNAYRPLGA